MLNWFTPKNINYFYQEEITMGIVYGYARVSTTGQCLDRQLDALIQAGVDKDLIYTEKMSGTKSNRLKLKALLNILELGDTVYIESLNRLGRSSADLITLMQTFSDMGVTLVSLKEQLDFSSASGKMIAQFLAVLAEFERSCIVECVNEGLAAARARGRVGGRPATPDKIIDKALKMYDLHNLTVSEICRACGISRPTLYKALRERENKKELEEMDNQD